MHITVPLLADVTAQMLPARSLMAFTLLTKVRMNARHATQLPRALLVLMNTEVAR
ncbi:hypothetical protein [Streptomyces sp. NBC_01615]|uniref:hypothetical protein n=1 Tax=Streptomyces sp. NBC_01615 TaxID=2975898 RepID=UPI00386BF1EE